MKESPTLSFEFEPRREKTVFFAYAKTKTQISFAVTAKLISAFVFATRIVQFLYFLNPKFQASSHLMWLYSPVCVGPGRKPRRPVFSQRGSFVSHRCYSQSLYNTVEMIHVFETDCPPRNRCIFSRFLCQFTNLTVL